MCLSILTFLFLMVIWILFCTPPVCLLRFVLEGYGVYMEVPVFIFGILLHGGVLFCIFEVYRFFHKQLSHLVSTWWLFCFIDAVDMVN